MPNRIHEDTPLYRSTEGLAVSKFVISLQAEVLMKSPCIEPQLLFVIYIGGVDEGDLYIVMCIIGYMLTHPSIGLRRSCQSQNLDFFSWLRS